MIEQKDNDGINNSVSCGVLYMKKSVPGSASLKLGQRFRDGFRWVSCCPQKNGFVFIDGKDTLGGCEKVYVDKIVDSGRGRDCLKTISHYTHWMPLPEVPESGSEGSN
ncbi:MAG: DUF551 domain-containing protein [Hahellaceae bacterium]|nr:DUF551 domain-containing protein [Hahellaceae bacterium]